jgi:uncharacterized protein
MSAGRPAERDLHSWVRARYLIVDGHSIIFAWSELRKLHRRRPALAREALLKDLRHYQDWSGEHVVAVFDGQGSHVNETSYPHDVQTFYARRGQAADEIVERLACKYASRFDVTVATSDLLEMETINACGAACVSPADLRKLLESARNH